MHRACVSLGSSFSFWLVRRSRNDMAATHLELCPGPADRFRFQGVWFEPILAQRPVCMLCGLFELCIKLAQGVLAVLVSAVPFLTAAILLRRTDDSFSIFRVR